MFLDGVCWQQGQARGFEPEAWEPLTEGPRTVGPLTVAGCESVVEATPGEFAVAVTVAISACVQNCCVVELVVSVVPVDVRVSVLYGVVPPVEEASAFVSES